MNRRDFLKATGGTVAALKLASRQAYAFSNSMPLTKFATNLRGVSTAPTATTPGNFANGNNYDIPVALPDASSIAPNPAHLDPLMRNGVDHYTIKVGQYTDYIHPSLTNGTKFWGYADGNNNVFRHLGGIIVAKRNKPCQLSFTNTLPTPHILPVDRSALFTDASVYPNSVAVHLHGGFVPWFSDGGPFDWWSPGKAHTGLSFLNDSVGIGFPCGVLGEAEYFYPNQQGARMMWYHDHAHDITRLNAYAGVATAYIIRDEPVEHTLLGLPRIEHGEREVPLVFQDKIFKNGNPVAVKTYPNYELPVGDLWYPYVYERNRWTLNSRRIPPVPSCVAEMFGDTMLVNGTVCPTVTLDPTWYRFRILNACNARFVNLQLIEWTGAGGGGGIAYDVNGNPTNASGPSLVQIGTEGGFLPHSKTFSGYNAAIDGTGTALVLQPTLDINGNPVVKQHNLLLAPAERADVLIDFSGSFAGKTFILYTDCPAPFPGGDPRNDYKTTTNLGPDTRTLMRIVVNSTIVSGAPTFTPTLGTGDANLAAAAADPAWLVTQVAGTPTAIPAGATVRDLTLNEDFDQYGRLIQLVGTCTPVGPGKFGRSYVQDGCTEYMNANATEVWRFANTTADTHPMHFHLVNAQILSRQKFNVTNFLNPASGSYGVIDTNLIAGTQVAPDDNELGWKETIRMNPGEVVTFIAKFELPQLPTSMTIPSSPRAATMGVTGIPVGSGGQNLVHEYVYHCHILEHEEHDMMRPLCVRS